jgi:TatD DNase family protein
MLADTHCHLDFDDYEGDRADVLQRAAESGLVFLINVGIDRKTSEKSAELARDNDLIYFAAGIHPHNASAADEANLKKIRDMLNGPKAVAIGEIGLDYYKDISAREDQRKVFEHFLKLSCDTGLPFICHARNSYKDALRLIKKVSPGPVKGVMHCFSGDELFLSECLRLGLYISFAGNLTFKNAGGLRAISAEVPLERLLLETDSPFLAPQERRGKRNEPSFVSYIAKTHADIRGIDESKIASQTTKNARDLFGID